MRRLVGRPLRTRLRTRLSDDLMAGLRRRYDPVLPWSVTGAMTQISNRVLGRDPWGFGYQADLLLLPGEALRNEE